MRQRLGIAQALVGRPQVLLLDEPVSALDPIGRHEVLDLMRELKGETTVFYSTHILDDVQRVSDHVAILDGGRLVRAAPTAELLETFTRDRLRVGIVGGTDDTAIDLAKLPGVLAVQPDDRDGDLAPTRSASAPRTPPRVQREVTRFASDHDLTLTENGLDPPRPGRRLPPPHRLEGACSMTAIAIADAARAATPPSPAVRSACAPSSARTRTEWTRGRRAWIVAVVTTRSWS